MTFEWLWPLLILLVALVLGVALLAAVRRVTRDRDPDDPALDPLWFALSPLLYLARLLRRRR